MEHNYIRCTIRPIQNQFPIFVIYPQRRRRRLEPDQQQARIIRRYHMSPPALDKTDQVVAVKDIDIARHIIC